MTQSANTINRSLHSKRVDSFYVSFYGLPENDANILGMFVKSIERPTINFNMSPNYNKGVKQQLIGNLEINDLTINFDDDENNFVLKALIEQIFRQRGMHTPASNSAKFEINVKVLRSIDNAVMEEFTLLRCSINTITPSEMIYNDSIGNTLSVTFSVDDVEYKFIE